MALTLTAIAIVASIVIASTAIVWWRQERIAYQPPPDRPVPPRDVRRVDYTAADGQPLYGYVLEPDEGDRLPDRHAPEPPHTPRGVLIAFHGNADLATWQIPWAREVARRTGWRVLLAEYRGYGGLPGTPDYEGVQRDALAAWRVAHERLGSHSRVTALFGHSLGSAIAVELAHALTHQHVAAGDDGAGASTAPRTTPAALLLQSPFTSARDMARIVSTRPVQMLWRVISRVHYDTRGTLRTLHIPVWIAHGDGDWLVPVVMGRELHAIARLPGALLVVPDARHNDVADRGGEAYWSWIAEALIAAENRGSGATGALPAPRRVGSADSDGARAESIRRTGTPD